MKNEIRGKLLEWLSLSIYNVDAQFKEPDFCPREVLLQKE